MKTVWTLLMLAAIAVDASAHFVFVVPKTGGGLHVVMSETLDEDDAVTVEKFKDMALSARVGGKDQPLKLTEEKHKLTGSIKDVKPSLLHGSAPYDVMKRGEGKPYLLHYLPKTILPGTGETAATLGDTCPLEIVPKTTGAETRLLVLAAGKPLADADVTVIPAEGKTVKLKTDNGGLTNPLELKGQTGVWTKRTAETKGKLGDKPYEEVRYYATLVFTPEAGVPALPKAVTSFGAVTSGDWMYVYGGHSGTRHEYDTSTALGTFHRCATKNGTAWEALAADEPLQGLALVEHRGSIIRVGGMSPKNAPGADHDLRSVATVRRYDPKTNAWTSMPDLPAPRSSHDAWVVGDTLVVVGGWEMKGKEAESTWPTDTLTLDLAAKDAKWVTIPQPFQRRALTAAAVGSKVYVVAGLGDDGKVHNDVDVLDVATKTWSKGPELPGKRSGFSPAAAIHGGKLYVSGNDGALHRLSVDGKTWEPAGTTDSKRMVARLIPCGAKLALIGGAGKDSSFAEVELVRVDR